MKIFRRASFGKVVRIENAEENLCFITLGGYSDGRELRVPYFGTVSRLWVGKRVRMMTERTGVFRLRFRQSIDGGGYSSKTCLTFSEVSKIVDRYNNSTFVELADERKSREGWHF